MDNEKRNEIYCESKEHSITTFDWNVEALIKELLWAQVSLKSKERRNRALRELEKRLDIKNPIPDFLLP